MPLNWLCKRFQRLRPHVSRWNDLQKMKQSKRWRTSQLRFQRLRPHVSRWNDLQKMKQSKRWKTSQLRPDLLLPEKGIRRITGQSG
eukprot:symbB.v1.2.035247.t1/scaffold4699.1/size36177/1